MMLRAREGALERTFDLALRGISLPTRTDGGRDERKDRACTSRTLAANIAISQESCMDGPASLH